MKKKLLISILIICAAISANAQVYTGLNENFDVACVTLPYPYLWAHFNPLVPTDPPGAWTCNPYNGNHGTPGMECTGVYGTPNAYHLDTSYLITPRLNISTLPGNIYIKFDSKTDRINLGAKLELIYTLDTPVKDTSTFKVLGMSPVFGNPDSSGWVTHEANITSLKTVGDFYITFRYTSTATSGSIWYLDNVIMSESSILLVNEQSNEGLPLKVVGNSTRNEINISYNIQSAGDCYLSIYDMTGREVHKEILNVQTGIAKYSIRGLDLHTGMYCIKMDAGNTYGITKVMIQ